MNQDRINQSLMHLGNSLHSLRKALGEKPNEIVKDASLKRFDLTFDLFWKSFKRCLELDGIHANTPKDALRKAYAAKLIDHDKRWLEMLDDRNHTSHVYDEALADKIYEHIKHNFPEMSSVYQKLVDKYLSE